MRVSFGVICFVAMIGGCAWILAGASYAFEQNKWWSILVAFPLMFLALVAGEISKFYAEDKPCLLCHKDDEEKKEEE